MTNVTQQKSAQWRQVCISSLCSGPAFVTHHFFSLEGNGHQRKNLDTASSLKGTKKSWFKQKHFLCLNMWLAHKGSGRERCFLSKSRHQWHIRDMLGLETLARKLVSLLTSSLCSQMGSEEPESLGFLVQTGLHLARGRRIQSKAAHLTSHTWTPSSEGDTAHS